MGSLYLEIECEVEPWGGMSDKADLSSVMMKTQVFNLGTGKFTDKMVDLLDGLNEEAAQIVRNNILEAFREEVAEIIREETGE